jgi:hypothetical protein
MSKSIIPCLLLCLGVVMGQSIAQNHIEWRSCDRNTYAFRYPANWQLDVSGIGGTAFFLEAPLSSKKDKFKENVNLVIADLRDFEIGLEQYTQLCLAGMERQLKDFKLVSSEKHRQHGMEYMEVIYAADNKGTPMLVFQRYWYKDKTGYSMTFSSEAKSFEGYKQIVMEMMDSLQIR